MIRMSCTSIDRSRSMTDNLIDKDRISSFAKLVRIALLFAVIVLVTGGSMAASQPNIARILQLTGYSAFGAILLGLLGIQVFFWVHRHEYHPSSRTVCTLNMIRFKIAASLSITLIPGLGRCSCGSAVSHRSKCLRPLILWYQLLQFHG